MLIHALGVEVRLGTIQSSHTSSYLPRILLRRVVPLKHLPEHHRAREHIDLVVVLRMCVPELGCLPVDGSDQALHHGPRGLLDLCQPKVGDLGRNFTGDEDVRGLAVTMDNRRLVEVVKVIQPTSDVQHEVQLDARAGSGGAGNQRRGLNYQFPQSRWFLVADVVEQVAVCAQLANHHDRRRLGVFRDADTELQRKENNDETFIHRYQST